MKATYTHGHHEAVLRSHRWRTAANSAAYLLPHLKPGLSLLDVGCGPATITADLAEAIAPGTLTAIEYVPEALELARAELDRRGVRNAVLEVADVHQLPYADDTFDVVHAHQVLQHLGDPVQALREMRRVCRPGGVVAVRDADFGGMTWYPAVPGLDDWNELYHRVARANGGEPDGGRKLLAWARAAGFADADITATADAWCYASPEDRAWWSDSWADRMSIAEVGRRAVAGGHASEEQLQAIATAWRAWGASPDAWFAVLHGELICRA